MSHNFGFNLTQPQKRIGRWHHINERKVIKGIIHKKCPICLQWVPETEYNKSINNPDAKQNYCKECQRLYNQWRRLILKKYHAQNLHDVFSFGQEEFMEEMRQYVRNSRLEVIEDETQNT